MGWLWGAIINRPDVGAITNRPHTDATTTRPPVGAIINRPHTDSTTTRPPVGAIINRPDADSTTTRPHIHLSEYGLIVERAIHAIPTHYPDVLVDKYVVMPNHVHMLLVSRSACTQDGKPMIATDNGQTVLARGGMHPGMGARGRLIIAPTSVSVVIQQFKQHVSKQIGFSLWQKSFYDRIIRSDEEYLQTWQYIDNNPDRWTEDEYYSRI